jgi:hypothetical protein
MCARYRKRRRRRRRRRRRSERERGGPTFLYAIAVKRHPCVGEEASEQTELVRGSNCRLLILLPACVAVDKHHLSRVSGSKCMPVSVIHIRCHHQAPLC